MAELPPLEAIVFDAGNTLVHVDAPWVVDFLRARGHDTDLARLDRGRRRANRVVEELLETPSTTDRDRWAPYFDRILAEAGVADPDERARCVEALRANDRERSLWRTVPPGTRETLAALRARGFRLAVISNSDGRIRGLLDELELAAFFELIVDSGVFGVEKPDPRIFSDSLARLGVAPAKSLYIGDLYAVDVVGARAAGMHACLLGDRRPDCLAIERLDELPSLVRRDAG